jgi:hypothetical protein
MVRKIVKVQLFFFRYYAGEFSLEGVTKTGWRLRQELML